LTVITISRGSKSMGTAVAEKVAEALGYECLSRSVLLEASEQYGISEMKLNRAMHDAPSLLERLGHRKAGYVACVRSALARHVSRDDIVYHGLAGHVLLRNVSHVLKVRIVASLELRASVVMRLENLSHADALAWIARVDKGRQKWSKSLYNVDPTDPMLYDLVLFIPRFSVDDAVEIICQCARLKQFATSTDSRRAMADLVLACDVKAALVDHYPDVSVTSTNGNVLVYCAPGERHGRKLRGQVAQLRKSIEGIHNIEVHVGASPPENAV
jgi:cytidylate kinase